MFEPLISKLNEMRVILATSSVQRQNILRSTKLKFEVVASTFEENLDRSQYTFSEYVQETAKCKVQDVFQKLKHDPVQPDIIIGMDTMVCCDGQMYGKPKNNIDAANTIRKLANSRIPHIVYTGVVIAYKERYDSFVETTTVYMNPLAEDEIAGYVDTGEPIGKAGAYAIQGIGGSFVSRIEGDFNNVVGLPLCAITKRLKELIS